MVIRVADPEIGLHGYVAIHRGGMEKPAFGATRMYAYPDEAAALTDVLRLSRIMTYKSALAGLPYGGAKAVLFPPADSVTRRQYLQTYARYVNLLNGHFVTGADAGLTEKDVIAMSSISRFMVGGKSDPVAYTIRGLLSACAVCLEEVFGSPSFSGRTVAVSGLGQTGLGLVSAMYGQAQTVYVADIDPGKLEHAKRLYPDIKITDFRKVSSLPVDVYAPCALSNAINERNAGKIKARVVIGSANSQLSDPQLGSVLYRRGILYAPDYVVNAGGLIAVTDEYEHGGHDAERVKRKVDAIGQTLRHILTESKKRHEAPNIVADRIAMKRSALFI